MVRRASCFVVAGLLASCAQVETKLATNDIPAVAASAAPSVPSPEQRYWLLRDEVQRLGGAHPWTGHYTSAGTDTSTEFLVAPENGWVLAQHGVSGLHFRGAGEVRELGGWLVFENDGTIADSRTTPMHLPVRWDGRRYLLRTSSVPYFLNRVNSGDEQREASRSFLVWGQHGTTRGAPELPRGIAESLFDPPLFASVLRVVPTKSALDGVNSRVELDVGRNRNVFVGMQLYPRRENVSYGFLKVIAVDEGTCTATCHGSTRDDPLESGATFASAPPDRWAERR